MNCSQVREKLNAYIDNEILDGSEQEIAHHLAVCARCQKFRQALVTPGFYVRKLNEMPQAGRHCEDPALLKKVRETKPAALPLGRQSPILPHFSFKAIAVSAAFVAAVFGFFMLADHFKSPSDERVLSEGREISFNTPTPVMVCLAEKVWISLEGKGKLYRGSDYVNVDMDEGSIYYVSDTPLFGPYLIIHAAGFQITNVRTEFFVKAENDKVGIELLTGNLVVKYGTKRNLQAARITAGTGALGTQEGKFQRLNTYELSDFQKVALARKIDQARKIGRFAENNPKQDKFIAGNTRIEFWRGD